MPHSHADWLDREEDDVSLESFDPALIHQPQGSFSLCKGCRVPWNNDPYDQPEKRFSADSVVSELDRHFRGPVGIDDIGAELGGPNLHGKRGDRPKADKASRSIALDTDPPLDASTRDSPVGPSTAWHAQDCRAHLQLGERIGRGGTWEVFRARCAALVYPSHPSADEIVVKIAVDSAHGENASKGEEAVRHEGQLFAGPLRGLQGHVVPTVYGIFLGTCTTRSRRVRAWIMMMEDVGIASTTDHLPTGIQYVLVQAQIPLPLIRWQSPYCWPV